MHGSFCKDLMSCTKRKATCSGTLNGIGVPSAYWASTVVSAGSPLWEADAPSRTALLCAVRAAGGSAIHAQAPRPANIQMETLAFFDVAHTSLFVTPPVGYHRLSGMKIPN